MFPDDMMTEDTEFNPFAEEEEEVTKEEAIPRNPEAPDESRRRLVERWVSKVNYARGIYADEFKQMRKNQRFARGVQWADNADDERYVVNVTLRHVQQRVATLYAKNPKAVAEVRKRINNTVWDGKPESLMQAQQVMMLAQQAGGEMMDPTNPQVMQMGQQVAQAMAVLQDAQRVNQEKQQSNLISRTLELVYQYNIDEQAVPFKTMMKLMVRRSITTGVGYVKLGFQRAMQRDPDIQRSIADFTQRLATAERIAADFADGELQQDDPEQEQLRIALQGLQAEPEIIVREGLTFDYPSTTSIIPDPNCKVLRDFVGAEWVAEEFVLSPDQVKEIYGIDVSGSFKGYTPKDSSVESEVLAELEAGENPEDHDKMCLVFEIWNSADGMVYTVCDGFHDFLREPAPPEVYTERFWPWFAYVPNECDSDVDLFPPSDVDLIRDMQQDLNRARQSLREHRHANRPKTAAAQGYLTPEDRDKLTTHPANAVIELEGLQPGQKVEDLLQPIKGPPMDPALYDTNPTYDDIQRSVGVQEANLGGTSSATATESSIAESSRMSSVHSNIDDLDDLLTGLAHSAGQILLLQVSDDTVKKIVGAGAVWPQMSKADIAEEIYLKVEAGSTGRPNQAQEIQNMERMAPLLLQIPGIDPKWLAKEMLRRLDDRADLDEAFSSQMPSIMAMNNQQQIGATAGGEDPNAQGAQGAGNHPKPGPGGPQPGPPSQNGPQSPFDMLN